MPSTKNPVVPRMTSTGSIVRTRVMRGAFVGSPSLLRILRRVGLGCQRSFSQSITTKGQQRQGILAAAYGAGL